MEPGIDAIHGRNKGDQVEEAYVEGAIVVN